MYFEVLPRNRAIRVWAGAGMAIPLQRGGDVPLDDFITLGRERNQRGYARTRFRDRLGWWTGIEYQWPIYEYQTTGVAISPLLFVDIGQVGPDLGSFVETRVRTSAGVALRGAHPHIELFEFQFGVSPEGPEFQFSVGKPI
jgi:outer membrane protein assembly factor BamA